MSPEAVKESARAAIRWTAVLLLGGAQPALSDAFEFAAIGDVPYSEADSLRFLRLRDLIDAEDLAFVLHVGDIKGGGALPAPTRPWRRGCASFPPSAIPSS